MHVEKFYFEDENYRVMLHILVLWMVFDLVSHRLEL